MFKKVVQLLLVVFEVEESHGSGAEALEVRLEVLYSVSNMSPSKSSSLYSKRLRLPIKDHRRTLDERNSETGKMQISLSRMKTFVSFIGTRKNNSAFVMSFVHTDP
jgi:hypothetical protein